MLTQRKLIVSLALILFTVCASASPIVYVLTGAGQFGTVDLGTGTFHQIGPDIPEGSGGLVPGPDGSLLTLALSGNLDSINPATGVTSVIGPTGLADCSSPPPASPCGPTSANAFGKLGGTIYATDFANNLYTVNPATGAATLIGLTGIPALPFIPLSTNPDGSFNFYGEALFGAAGKLYSTFFTGTTDFMSATPVILDNLYQIDPSTGRTTLIGPTAFGLDTVVDVNGTFYAFRGDTHQIVTLNLANGNTSFVSNVDPAAGLIFGASPVPVPEPASIALVGLGMVAVVFCTRRRRLYALALSLAVGVLSTAFGQGPTFTTIEFPGATSTNAFGINTRGDIVGNYVNADKSDHGFLLSGGQYSTIDFPGATTTEAFAINPRGDVGGFYILAGVTHGFLLSEGQFSTIDFPGAPTAEVGAINARGDILGDYTLAGARHGFLLTGGQFTKIDFPGAATTLPVAFNPQGDISGVYSSAGVFHGFLLSDGDFTSLDVPAATRTGADGINARGDIIGRYVASGVSHGFLLSGGQFSTIDFPGATFTSADAINQRGDIVGRYIVDGVTRGYLLLGFRQACVVPMAPPQVAAVTHSTDFTLVTASKPAAAGEVLSIFAKGLGPTRPGVAAGQPFPSSPLAPVDSLVEVRVNGRSAIVFGAVGFPGAVDGYQVNFRLPISMAKGSASIELSASGVAGTPVNIIVQ